MNRTLNSLSGSHVIRHINIGLHRVKRAIRKVVDRGSGFDLAILQTHGSALDAVKARAVGSVNLAASSLGAVGAFIKVTMITPAPYSLFAGLTMAILYGTLTYNLERILSSAITPLMSYKQKAVAFGGRFLVSLLLAGFQAAPWVALALGGQVESQLASMSIQERSQAREKLNQIHGTADVRGTEAAIEKQLGQASAELNRQPEEVIDAKQLASQCTRALETTLAQHRVTAATLNNRAKKLRETLKLSTVETAKNDATVELAKIEVARQRLADDYLKQKDKCAKLEIAAKDTHDRWLTNATAERDKAASALEDAKKKTTEAAAAVSADVGRADSLIAKTYKANSTAEAKALWYLVKNEGYAMLVAALIWLFFLIIDLSPISLKMMLKAGPYDFALKHFTDVQRLEQETARIEVEERNAIAKAESQARKLGIEHFFAEDKGAVFARAEKLKHEETLGSREAIRDVVIARAQLDEIERLVASINAARERASTNPALLARLDGVIAVLAGNKGMA